jgi:heparanase 1
MKQVAVNLIIAAALVAAASNATLAAAEEAVSIDAGRLPWVRNIDERFQSFQIGMSHLTGGETWRSYDSAQQDGKSDAPKDFAAVREPRPPADLSNPRLRTLAAALGPFYVRYGGTTSNSVYFQDDDELRLAKAPEGYSVVLTRTAWKGGLEFAKAVDAKVVTGFTVSSGVRDSSGAWTPRIAAPWLAYTRAIGGEIYAAELFNEPNAPEPGRMPKGQSASDFARDFAAFRSFMDQAAPNMKLAGPGVATLGVPVPVSSLEHTTPEQYMAADPKPTFDIVSYHFYGALAERCAPPDSPVGISVDQALSEAWLARPDNQFQRHKALRDRHAPGAPIWLTETGAAACGGTQWQPTFLDTFRYLDTQARLAKQGLDAIFTHALISGSNGVIDEKSLQPNADYWAALLWRKLMGTRVLDAGPMQPGLHMYAHCQRGASGGITVLAINMKKTPAKFDFSGPADLYALTATELQSKTVRLNGQPLALGADDTLPVLKPTRVKAKLVTLAPTSVNFIVLPKAKNASCAG